MDIDEDEMTSVWREGDDVERRYVWHTKPCRRHGSSHT
jgi:hypothetical protein